jgi:hypothetical protein
MKHYYTSVPTSLKGWKRIKRLSRKGWKVINVGFYTILLEKYEG